MDIQDLTSLDWKSLVIAKKASVASVVPKCSPYINKRHERKIGDETVEQKQSQDISMKNLTSYTWQLAFYLVEEVDDLGEDVQASPRVDGGLIKNTCLSTGREQIFSIWPFIFVYFIAV